MCSYLPSLAGLSQLHIAARITDDSMRTNRWITEIRALYARCAEDGDAFDNIDVIGSGDEQIEALWLKPTPLTNTERVRLAQSAIVESGIVRLFFYANVIEIEVHEGHPWVAPTVSIILNDGPGYAPSRAAPPRALGTQRQDGQVFGCERLYLFADYAKYLLREMYTEEGGGRGGAGTSASECVTAEASEAMLLITEFEQFVQPRWSLSFIVTILQYMINIWHYMDDGTESVSAQQRAIERRQQESQNREAGDEARTAFYTRESSLHEKSPAFLQVILERTAWMRAKRRRKGDIIQSMKLHQQSTNETALVVPVVDVAFGCGKILRFTFDGYPTVRPTIEVVVTEEGPDGTEFTYAQTLEQAIHDVLRKGRDEEDAQTLRAVLESTVSDFAAVSRTIYEFLWHV